MCQIIEYLDELDTAARRGSSPQLVAFFQFDFMRIVTDHEDWIPLILIKIWDNLPESSDVATEMT